MLTGRGAHMGLPTVPYGPSWFSGMLEEQAKRQIEAAARAAKEALEAKWIGDSYQQRQGSRPEIRGSSR